MNRSHRELAAHRARAKDAARTLAGGAAYGPRCVARGIPRACRHLAAAARAHPARRSCRRLDLARTRRARRHRARCRRRLWPRRALPALRRRRPDPAAGVARPRGDGVRRAADRRLLGHRARNGPQRAHDRSMRRRDGCRHHGQDEPARASFRRRLAHVASRLRPQASPRRWTCRRSTKPRCWNSSSGISSITTRPTTSSRT